MSGRISFDGPEGGFVVTFNSYRNASLKATLVNGAQLSSRSAALCIFALSLLSWAIVLVPLWVAIR